MQGEVARLHEELQRTNAELERSLEENARMRKYLARVVEKLPCGVVVISGEQVQIINPEARRLLGMRKTALVRSVEEVPAVFEALRAGILDGGFFSEQERSIAGESGWYPTPTSLRCFLHFL